MPTNSSRSPSQSRRSSSQSSSRSGRSSPSKSSNQSDSEHKSSPDVSQRPRLPTDCAKPLRLTFPRFDEFKQRRKQNSNAQFSKTFAPVMAVAAKEGDQDSVAAFFDKAWTLWDTKENECELKVLKRCLYYNIVNAIKMMTVEVEVKRREAGVSASGSIEDPFADTGEGWEILFEKAASTTTFAQWKGVTDEEFREQQRLGTYPRHFSFFNNTA
ncbi:hypothetical protein V5O48_014364 [Marasmius crinis-equi]|uniref:Uncharacterized protein n=1 Tax=Marasmius crinis-equi TaxID=585013 RepID=A0ABR3EXH6_9AGAR